MVFQVVDQCSKEFISSAFKTEKFKTDTTVFRLHYKFSTWMVILYSVCYMYIQLSNPISCIGSKHAGCGECRKVLNDFCWVHGTYSVMNTSNPEGRPEMYPGFGISSLSSNDRVTNHYYYKWMYFYIAAMIILLHTPRQTWRFIEAGRIKALVSKLDWKVLVRDEEVQKQEGNLVKYICEHLGYHKRYSGGFFFCEFLNVVVSGTLLYMWELISEHQLSWSSFKYLRSSPASRTDQLTKVFPLMGKCIFNDYGPSGSIQTHDVMCVLPLNVINERAAMFFWCYFIILLTFGILQLLFRILLFCSKRLRASILKGNSTLLSMDDIKIIVNHCGYSDWFIINQMSFSVEPFIYKEVMRKFAEKLQIRSDTIVISSV